MYKRNAGLVSMLPVPVRYLQSAWKDTGIDPLLMTFTVRLTALPGMTKPKSRTYSGSLNLEKEERLIKQCTSLLP